MQLNLLRSIRRWRGRFVWPVFLCLPGLVWAGNFSVAPVRLYMSVKDRAIAVTVENEGNTPVAVQAETFAWSQTAQGEDKLTPSDDLIVSPPIAKIPPRGRQVLRLARVAPPDLVNQLSYRLVVSEIPEVTPSKTTQASGKAVAALGVEFHLAMSMPVFITPPAAKRELVCQFGRSPKLGLTADCKNIGTAYAQVRKVTFLQGDKELGQFESNFSYILPGASQVLSFKPIQQNAILPSGATIARILFDDGKLQDISVQIP